MNCSRLSSSTPQKLAKALPPPPPGPARPPAGRLRGPRCGSVPAERVAGGGPGRAARLCALGLRARVRVVGGQHHAARVLHLHPQRRMSPRRPRTKSRTSVDQLRERVSGPERPAPHGSTARAAPPARGPRPHSTRD